MVRENYGFLGEKENMTPEIFEQVLKAKRESSDCIHSSSSSAG